MSRSARRYASRRASLAMLVFCCGAAFGVLVQAADSMFSTPHGACQGPQK